MPRVHGDTFIHIDDVDFILPCDEPLLVYNQDVSDELADQIGKYVARIVEDGDTIQVGYGSIPNAILANLEGKKHLGVHTELLSDGIVEPDPQGGHRQQPEDPRPGQDGGHLLHGHPGHLRVPRRQSLASSSGPSITPTTP